MAVGLPALTYVLEEGQRKDWYGSPVIVDATILAVVGIGAFIARELMTARPFINLRVLKNRSVGGGCLLMTVLGAVSFGSIYIIPVYCAQIQGYNAQQIGYVVMWSGLPQLVLFPLMPRIMRLVDARLLVIAGTLFFAASCFINVNLTHDVGMDQLILPQLMRAIGQPLFTIPLSQLSTAGLAPRDTADASALSMMMRNLGGSIGIAVLATVIERRENFHFSVLAEAITNNAVRTQERLAAMAGAAHGRIADLAAAKMMAIGQLAAAGPPGGLRVRLCGRVLDRRRGPADQPPGGRHPAQARPRHRTDRSALTRRVAAGNEGTIMFEGVSYAAQTATTGLAPMSFQRRDTGADDVRIERRSTRST